MRQANAFFVQRATAIGAVIVLLTGCALQPPAKPDVRGVVALFDRQLGDINKLEVAPLTNSSTIVDIIPAGATVLKGFELIGAADDFSYPQRRPSSVTVAGSRR